MTQLYLPKVTVYKDAHETWEQSTYVEFDFGGSRYIDNTVDMDDEDLTFPGMQSVDSLIYQMRDELPTRMMMGGDRNLYGYTYLLRSRAPNGDDQVGTILPFASMGLYSEGLPRDRRVGQVTTHPVVAWNALDRETCTLTFDWTHETFSRSTSTTNQRDWTSDLPQVLDEFVNPYTEWVLGSQSPFYTYKVSLTTDPNRNGYVTHMNFAITTDALITV